MDNRNPPSNNNSQTNNASHHAYFVPVVRNQRPPLRITEISTTEFASTKRESEIENVSNSNNDNTNSNNFKRQKK